MACNFAVAAFCSAVFRDKITSVAFKDQCALATYGVEEKVDLTPEEQDPTKKQYIKKVTPLDDWIAEQKAAQG